MYLDKVVSIAYALESARVLHHIGSVNAETGLPIRQGHIHRGGLRAQIIRSGLVCVGDTIAI